MSFEKNYENASNVIVYLRWMILEKGKKIDLGKNSFLNHPNKKLFSIRSTSNWHFEEWLMNTLWSPWDARNLSSFFASDSVNL